MFFDKPKSPLIKKYLELYIPNDRSNPELDVILQQLSDLMIESINKVNLDQGEALNNYGVALYQKYHLENEETKKSKETSEKIIQAIEIIEKAARLKNKVAECNLGIYYFHLFTQEKEKDTSQKIDMKNRKKYFQYAQKWLRRSVAQDYSNAKFNLGMLLINSNFQETDNKEAIKYLKEAVKDDVPIAKEKLEQLETIIEYQKKMNKLLFQEKKGKDINTWVEIVNLSIDYQYIPKAIEYCEKLIAHQSPFGYYYLGKLHYDGLMGNRQLDVALEKFRKARDLGIATTIEDIDDIIQILEDDQKDVEELKNSTKPTDWYILAEKYWEEDRFEDAIKYYRKGFQEKHLGCTFNLAICYRDGVGVQRSLKEYQKLCFLFIKWAEVENNLIDMGKGYYDLGAYYYYQQLSLSLSIKFLQKAVECGNASAFYLMGLFYRDGKEPYLKKNYQKAISNLSEACNMQHSEAMYQLGKFYYNRFDDEEVYQEVLDKSKEKLNGKCVQETKKAIKYLGSAAKRGHNGATLLLAHILSNGLGIAPQPEKGLLLYGICVLEGSNEAYNQLLALSEQNQDILKKYNFEGGDEEAMQKFREIIGEDSDKIKLKIINDLKNEK